MRSTDFTVRNICLKTVSKICEHNIGTYIIDQINEYCIKYFIVPHCRPKIPKFKYCVYLKT